jgi:hypothetical protein
MVLAARFTITGNPHRRRRVKIREMFRFATLLILAAALLNAATIRLYLKDGNFHKVREYEAQGDRVRYYSTERSEWEVIPLALVDLKRTEAEIAENETERREEAKILDAEDEAERAQRREVESIPVNPGVYLVEGEKVTTLKQAEVKVVNNKGRSILRAIVPIPVISGKSTVEIDGLKAPTTLNAGRPEFYFRLAERERMAIIRLAPEKKTRLVQKWNVIPVTNEIMEETDLIETFKQQIADGLYKIWPTKPLDPGEYAVVEYTEGEGNIQVWDFSISSK